VPVLFVDDGSPEVLAFTCSTSIQPNKKTKINLLSEQNVFNKCKLAHLLEPSTMDRPPQ